MTRRKWRAFLTRWSSELMAGELAERVDPAPESTDWLGFGPAGEEDLGRLEARLGLILPPSYRSFLLTSDGWRRTTFAIGRIRPAAEVERFRVENEQWADIYSESGSDLPDAAYYVYPDGSGDDHRGGHMHSLVQVSDVEDGVYLLNPEAVTPDGEWEAWFFANWIPGARRYPSFAHLMVGEYRSFSQLERGKVDLRGLPRLAVPGPEVPRVPAERARRAVARAPEVEELVAQIGELEGKPLDRALRTFHGKLHGRPAGRRRPELVPILAELYRTSPHPGVRSACVHAATEFAVDPPPLLLESLSDPDPWVVLSGIFALHHFPDPEAVGPLCRFIGLRANPMINESAMGALGALGDARAVPTLSAVLLDTSNLLDQSFATAALALSRCGPEGFAALVSALDHADPRVRRAAVVGVDCSGDPGAGDLLDRMEADPDPAVRERARVRVGRPPW